MYAVKVNLECRYNAQITVQSGEFTVEEPAQKKSLVFDLKVLSSIEPSEELKQPDSRLYQQKAGEIVNDLFLNWSSEDRIPSKIEVLQFVFVDRDEQARSSTQDIHVILQFTYQNDLGVPEPVAEEVSEYTEEIIQTINTLQEKDATFVSEDNVNSVTDIVFTLAPIQSFAMLVGYGQLDSQFSLNFFKNVEMDQVATKVRMGDTFFATTKWASPVTDVGFHIDTCKYLCGDQCVDIIKV